MFLGIFYNLSVWYKLTNKTLYGALIALTGAAITIGLNIYLIPRYGYIGAAWTNFAAYFTMMVISYIWGQKVYPVPYNKKRILLYLSTGGILYFISVRHVTVLSLTCNISETGYSAIFYLYYL